MQTTTQPTVLIVDDESDIRFLARVILEAEGFAVVGEAFDGLQAVEQYLELNPPPGPSVVLIDNRMPRLTGLEAAEQILARYPDQVMVLFTAHIDGAIEARARELGIAACVTKTRANELPALLRGLLEA